MIYKHESKTTFSVVHKDFISKGLDGSPCLSWGNILSCCSLFGGTGTSTCDTAWHEEDESKQGKYNRIDHCQHLQFLIVIMINHDDDDDDNENHWIDHCLCLLGVNSGASLASRQLISPNQPTCLTGGQRPYMVHICTLGAPGLEGHASMGKTKPINLTNGPLSSPHPQSTSEIF